MVSSTMMSSWLGKHDLTDDEVEDQNESFNGD